MYRWYITPQDYELALSNGISESVLNDRVRGYGWDIDRACREPLHRRKLKDILTAEIVQKLKDNNITFKAFRARVFTLGWDIDKAMNTPTLSKKEAIALATDSIRIISAKDCEIAEKNGIKLTTLRTRVVRGWNIEKAINTPTMTASERAKSSYFHKSQDSIFKIT